MKNYPGCSFESVSFTPAVAHELMEELEITMVALLSCHGKAIEKGSLTSWHEVAPSNQIIHIINHCCHIQLYTTNGNNLLFVCLISLIYSKLRCYFIATARAEDKATPIRVSDYDIYATANFNDRDTNRPIVLYDFSVKEWHNNEEWCSFSNDAKRFFEATEICFSSFIFRGNCIDATPYLYPMS